MGGFEKTFFLGPVQALFTIECHQVKKKSN